MILTLENLTDYADEEGGYLIWRWGVNSHGAPSAYLGGVRGVSVRRYVLIHLMGQPERRGCVVSSRCGNCRCISPKCLQQITKGSVIRRQYQSGARTQASAKAVGLAAAMGRSHVRLTPEKAAEIRASELPSEELAPIYGVTPRTIEDVRALRRWAPQVTGASVFSWRP